MKRVVIILIAMLAITSCAPDPRREASAYATRKEADSTSAMREQARQQDAEMHELTMSRLNDVSAWISTVMQSAMIATAYTLFISIISLGIGLAFASLGAGIGYAKRNLLKPNEIRLDPVTRQFPLLVTKVQEGKYTLSNPNTGSVTFLYERNDADKMMIQAMSATQHDGALAYQSRLSHKPGEVASIQSPQIIDIEV